MKTTLTAEETDITYTETMVRIKISSYARAIQEITGQAPAPTTRSAAPLMRGKALKVPAIYRRGHEGMIKLPE